MIDPYRMVIVNVLALTTLLCALGFWKYILHRKIKPEIIVILFSILPVISVFRKGVYESGDFNLQIYRAIDFYNSLSSGILLPRWGSELNAYYGHPVFLFVSNLQFYIISFFHFLGLSYIASAKLLLIVFFILSGLTMFYFVKKHFGENAALISSLFYLFTPFHLVDLHFRVSYGDVIAFALYPLSFLFATNLLEKKSLKSFALLSLIIFSLVISHPITMPAIIYLTIYILFIYIIKYRNLKNLIVTASSIFFGGMLSAFYWLPLITESKYTYEGVYVNNVLFQNLTDLLFSTWRYGLLFQGSQGELSFLIGYAHIVIIFISLYLLMKARKFDYHFKIIAFLLTSTFLFLFLITKYSEPIWEMLPLLGNIQFSYRLLFIVTFITSFIAGLVAKKLRFNFLIGVICLLAISSTILNWGHRRVIPEINDSILIANVPYSTFQVEGHPPELPIWRDFTNPWMKTIPNFKLESVDSTNKIIVKEIDYSPNGSEFLVFTEEDTLLKRNIFYFPGWKAYDNGNETKIYFEKDGIVHVRLKPGIHKLEFQFENTREVKFANLISLLSFFALFIVVLYNFFKKLSRIN